MICGCPAGSLAATQQRQQSNRTHNEQSDISLLRFLLFLELSQIIVQAGNRSGRIFSVKFEVFVVYVEAFHLHTLFDNLNSQLATTPCDERGLFPCYSAPVSTPQKMPS